MKKQLIIAASSFVAILFMGTKAQAQIDTVGTGTADVRIELSDFVSIDTTSGVSTGDNDIVFTYDTPGKYNDPNGQSIPKSAHLVITATKGYTIKVKGTGTGDNFTTSTSSEIPLNVLSIQASSAATGPGTTDVISLSNVDQDLIEGATLGAAKSYDVNYFITHDNAINELLGKDSGDYTATVTYTIVAL